MRLVARSKKTWLGLAASRGRRGRRLVRVGHHERRRRGGRHNRRQRHSRAPTPTPLPKPPQAPVETALPARIVIPSIGVDAPISVKSLGPDGTMQPPNGPEDVAWYDFTARPGSGGNAVFSAHVDYHDYGPAVFAKLKDLQKGDAIEVRLADATSLPLPGRPERDVSRRRAPLSMTSSGRPAARLSR